MPTKRCARLKEKGKCSKKRISKRRCRKTCSGCNGWCINSRYSSRDVDLELSLFVGALISMIESKFKVVSIMFTLTLRIGVLVWTIEFFLLWGCIDVDFELIKSRLLQNTLVPVNSQKDVVSYL